MPSRGLSMSELADVDLYHWNKDAKDNGWEMPVVAGWKRLPVIRHVRTILGAIAVERHNHVWRSLGAIPTGYDSWVLYGMWRGWERTK